MTPGSALGRANNVELAYVHANASWMNSLGAHFQTLRHFTLRGSDDRSHVEQSSMIQSKII